MIIDVATNKMFWGEGVWNEGKNGIVAMPAKREAKKAQNESVIAGIETERSLVIVSLTARKNTAANANKVAGLNPSWPGWVTSRTPKKPINKSIHLGPDTRCWRNSAPPATIARGVAWIIAEEIDREPYTTAETKDIAAASSQNERTMNQGFRVSGLNNEIFNRI